MTGLVPAGSALEIGGPRRLTTEHPTSRIKELPMPLIATTRRLERQTKRGRRAHIASLRSHKASGARFVLAIAAGRHP